MCSISRVFKNKQQTRLIWNADETSNLENTEPNTDMFLTSCCGRGRHRAICLQ